MSWRAAGSLPLTLVSGGAAGGLPLKPVSGDVAVHWGKLSLCEAAEGGLAQQHRDKGAAVHLATWGQLGAAGSGPGVAADPSVPTNSRIAPAPRT